MTQAELNNAISEATGDDLRHIQQRGFSLVEAIPRIAFNFEASLPDPSVIDWDSSSGATQSFFECC